jgi:rhamnosyltransferase subunit B
MGKKILLTTLGSFGDLHPYIAVGLGLRERGHAVTIATSQFYRAKVEGEGLRFHPLRPDIGLLIDDSEALRRGIHPRTGTEYVFRKLILPWIEQSFEDTLQAARAADLIVGHPIAFATPTVAEYLRKPWYPSPCSHRSFFPRTIRRRFPARRFSPRSFRSHLVSLACFCGSREASWPVGALR